MVVVGDCNSPEDANGAGEGMPMAQAGLSTTDSILSRAAATDLGDTASCAA